MREQVPVAGEALHRGHLFDAHGAGGQDLIGRLGAVDHLMRGVVTGDGGAAQALEDPHLDLLGPQGHEAVEPGAEARQIFPW